jgi:DNA modification methylase
MSIENLSVEEPWLMLGDCVEKMQEIPDGSIDLTVTSPPYDGLRLYDGYSFDFEAVAKELYRVTSDGGIVVWIVNDSTVQGTETLTSFKQALFFKEKCKFNVHDTMVWVKTNPPPQTKVGRRYTSSFEYMFILSKGKIKTFNPLEVPTKTGGQARSASRNAQRSPNGIHREDRKIERVVNDTKKLNNVWEIAKMGQGTLHPAQFPEKLAEDHILSWSNEGDIVLDPFMGSGTTGKSAATLSRRFIGIELSERYMEIARARICNSPNGPLPFVESVRHQEEFTS